MVPIPRNRLSNSSSHGTYRKKSRNKNFAKGNLPKVTMTCIVDFSRKILHPTFWAVNSERDGLKMEGRK